MPDADPYVNELGVLLFAPPTIENITFEVANTVVAVGLVYACIITDDELAAVGVPVIVPVVLFNVKPVGRIAPTPNV